MRQRGKWGQPGCAHSHNCLWTFRSRHRFPSRQVSSVFPSCMLNDTYISKFNCKFFVYLWMHLDVCVCSFFKSLFKIKLVKVRDHLFFPYSSCDLIWNNMNHGTGLWHRKKSLLISSTLGRSGGGWRGRAVHATLGSTDSKESRASDLMTSYKS